MNTFYEAFGIEPTEEKYCLWECKIPELKDIACNNTKCEHYRHKINYPPITLEIERKLEEIIFEYVYNQWKTPLDQIYTVIAKPKTCYVYQIWKKRKCLHSVEGKTRQEALLKLCVQLKNEIKEEVKAVFNE